MHRLIEAAADGALPQWADVTAKRAEHVARVASLLGEWADALDLGDEDRQRWRAAGILHDAFHDAPHSTLRPMVAEQFRDLPGKMLHGPACAVRLRDEGVDDESLLHAITYHTIGHPDFDTLGLGLYAADFLEPGRAEEPAVRAAMRSRMPAEMDTVVPLILQSRIRNQVDRGRRIRPETVAFWNAIPDERRP